MVEPLNNRTAPPPERVANSMERPALDNRSYRVVKLQNELEALLIHDPETDKASGALDVNVGSFSDTDDMPGLAHAVEHMLFMGTEKVCWSWYDKSGHVLMIVLLVSQGKCL
jgi:insulysin